MTIINTSQMDEDAIRRRNRELGEYGMPAPATVAAPTTPTAFAFVVALEGKDHYIVRMEQYERWQVPEGHPVATDLVSVKSPKPKDYLTFPSKQAAHAALRVLLVRHPWAVKWRLVEVAEAVFTAPPSGCP